MTSAPDPWQAPPEWPPRSVLVRDCTACGACCSAPDIHALGKPLGMPCRHLDPACLCGIYAARPPVCRNYSPDWVCGEVAPLPSLDARIRRFLDIYGLTDELTDEAGAVLPGSSASSPLPP